MFPAASLLATVLLACSLGAAASPAPLVDVESAKLSFTARIVNTTGTRIVDVDRARIAHLKQAAADGHKDKRASYSFSVTNAAVTYLASIGVGSPATYYDLLIDTGSSNTWIGANKTYVQTPTSVDTGDDLFLLYGSGLVIGTEYTDTVTLSPSLVITNQSIGVAVLAFGFSGEDGILGIGPTDLTEDTISNVTSVPTVTDNLYSQGTISTNAVGIYYAPTTSESTTNGELTFGGPDPSKYTGTLDYVPLTSTSPASLYWGIYQSISFNGTTILSSTAGIVDTGTTLIYIATDAFNKYKDAVGAKLDKKTGLLRIKAKEYANLKPLVFTIGSQTYTLSVNGQIWPRSLTSYIGGTDSHIYLVVNYIGTDSGSGLDFINGYTFLERFYTVYDTTNKRFGIATTAFTDAETN